MKETKKQLKARLINEISAKYSSKITEMMVENAFLKNEVLNCREQVSNLREENRELREQLEKYEDWNRRLQEFMDMTPEEREKVIQDSKLRVSTNQRLNKIMDMFQYF